MDNQPKPVENTEGLNPEGQQPQGTEVTPQVTPQEEETLYAGRFKTPEELEDAYKASSQEGIRLAGEVKRLMTQSQQAQTPAKKEEVQDKIVDLTQHFDPETAKILQNYFGQLLQTKLDGFQKTTAEQNSFQSQVTESWEETKKDYPDAANPQSKLYIRANEILMERGLALQNPDGTVQLLTPFAYRMAVEAAVAESNRQAPANAQTRTNKSKAGAIQGRGSKTAVQGKLSYDQYNALTDEQKDAYDKSQL